MAAKGELELVFHRAFDSCRAPLEHFPMSQVATLIGQFTRGLLVVDGVEFIACFRCAI